MNLAQCIRKDFFAWWEFIYLFYNFLALEEGTKRSSIELQYLVYASNIGPTSQSRPITTPSPETFKHPSTNIPNVINILLIIRIKRIFLCSIYFSFSQNIHLNFRNNNQCAGAVSRAMLRLCSAVGASKTVRVWSLVLKYDDESAREFKFTGSINIQTFGTAPPRPRPLGMNENGDGIVIH